MLEGRWPLVRRGGGIWLLKRDSAPVGRLNGRRAVLDENREIQPFADWNEVEAIADELHPHYRAIPTMLVGTGLRPKSFGGSSGDTSTAPTAS